MKDFGSIEFDRDSDPSSLGFGIDRIDDLMDVSWDRGGRNYDCKKDLGQHQAGGCTEKLGTWQNPGGMMHLCTVTVAA